MFSFFTKTTLLTLFALCLQCLVSCTKDWAELSGDNSKESGWMSVSISLPAQHLDVRSSAASSSTRAAANSVANGNTGDTYVGSAKDNSFDKLVLAIYNFEGAFVDKIEVTANDVVGGSFQRNPFKVKARKLKPANYYVFAITNPDNNLTRLFQTGKTIADLQAAQSGQDPDSVYNSKGITMCSTEIVPLHYWSIRTTKDEAEAEPLHITLERFVAKVFVDRRKGDRIPAPNAQGGTAEFVEFYLAGFNKKAYLVRKHGQSLKANGTPTTDAPLVQETGSTPPINQYAIDPNMEEVPSRDFSSHFLSKTKEKPGGWDDDNGIYATENTVNADNQKANQLTHAVVRIKYIPKFLPAGTNTWAYYKGVYMNYAQLATRFQAVINNNASDESLDMPTGWATTVRELYNNSVKVNDRDAVSFDKYGLKFYKDGVCDYLIPIRHFSDTQQPKLNAYGRYGVVRNHIYKIAIRSVSGVGSPGLPPLDDTPADQLPTYIASDITVLPWTEAKQDKFVLE